MQFIILTICNFSYSRFGFEGWMWVLIASVPSIYILLLLLAFYWPSLVIIQEMALLPVI